MRKRFFLALHNAIDTDILMVLASCVRRQPGGDAGHMVVLVSRAPGCALENIYADKVSISRRNVQFIANLGSYTAIESRMNMSVNSRGHWTFGRLIRAYLDEREELKQVHQYGPRRPVETVFSMLKLRFGGGLTSRSHKQQRSELLIKMVLHNIERLNFLEYTGPMTPSPH